jgi:hypothetical protein
MLTSTNFLVGVAVGAVGYHVWMRYSAKKKGA